MRSDSDQSSTRGYRIVRLKAYPKLAHRYLMFFRIRGALLRALETFVVPANMQSTRSIGTSRSSLMEPRNWPLRSGVNITREDSTKPRFEFHPTAMISKSRPRFSTLFDNPRRPATDTLPI